MLLSLALVAAMPVCPVLDDWNGCDLKKARITSRQHADITRLAVTDDDEESPLEVIPAHLSVDPSQQLVVYQPCSSQNCPMWVFALRKDRAVLILSSDFAESHGGPGYKRLKTIHHGFHDLVFVGFSGGAGEYQQFYAWFEFDGARYRPVSCRSSTTNNDDDRGEVWDGPVHPCTN